MFQNIRDFKTPYVLIIKYIPTFKSNYNQIILSSNKIQLLKKQ